jgi:hypothetical protein
MEKKNVKILVIIVLSLVVLLIIAAVKFNVLKKIGFKKFNQSNLNVVNTNNVNPGQGEKYEKVVDSVSISFTKLDGWKYEELPATEEYKFALKFYKSSKDKYATLYFYNMMSGVCGTDRRVDTLNLNNGNKLNVGYSTADNIWRDILFSLNSKDIVIVNHTLDKVEAENFLEMVKTFDVVKNKNTNDKLTLTLKEGSLSNSGAVFVLENKSDKVYTYGAEYDIEVKTDNGWKKVEDSRNKAWTQVLYVSEPNKTNNIAVDFSELKTKLVSGKHYRVVKRLIEEVGGNKEYYLNAEFQMR